MENYDFFSYSWHMDDSEPDQTRIRVYGLDDKNENVCVRIDNFTPYVYLELPDNIDWDVGKAQMVANKIDFLMGDKKPLAKQLMWKKRLYYANMSKGKRRMYPYLMCSFCAPGDLKTLGYKLIRPMRIAGIGLLKLKMHEHNASPILQMTSLRKIPTAGWIRLVGRRVPKDEQTSTCEHEFRVKWKNLMPKDSDVVARPLVMGYDIEVNSTNPTAMPNADKPGDKIFQISCVLARQGCKEEQYQKYLLTLGDPADKYMEGIHIRKFETEHDLLIGFTEFIQEFQPNVVVGYNIFTFDIPYMIARAKQAYCIYEFDKQGMDKNGHAAERTIKWSSQAYKNQEFSFLDAEGRLFVDLLPLVKRDYKMSNYKLKTISTHFLGATKDDLDPKGIFKCYRIGMKGVEASQKEIKSKKDLKLIRQGRRAISICGKYCVKDSELVVRLFDTLTTWIGLCEMAKVCQVPIFTLYTQGQQVKVFSQVYSKCTHENTVVEKDGYMPGENDHYVGATVFPPVPGVYDKVIPLDFSSLYPSVIIAYNICWSTLVTDQRVPDELCHLMSWEDHIGCPEDPKEVRKTELTKIIKVEDAKLKEIRRQRDLKSNKLLKEEFKTAIAEHIERCRPLREERSNLMKSKPKHKMCCKRNFRWLKEPMGVLPEILSHLLGTRSATKKEMKRVKGVLAGMEPSDPEYDNVATHIDVLDKRQLALKVSANSGYGATGVQRGYLPMMPVAMCTTYMGRKSIELAAKSVVEDHKGVLIYGDTDCVRANTPVMIRYDGEIDYKTVEEISCGKWKRINENKEMASAKPGYEIWSDTGFTKIVNVVRCVAKPMSRIVTHAGVVECSNEHSLLRDDCTSVTPLELKIKDDLCIAELPLPTDTPENPMYCNITTQLIGDYLIPDTTYCGVSAELAFVWGLFYADGSCGEYVAGNGYVKKSWAINNQDNKLLDRCVQILDQTENKLSFKILEVMKSSRVNKLVPFMTVRKHNDTIGRFVRKYRKMFYDSRKNKRIPKLIFNAPLKIRQAFFMGYYSGDGDKKDPGVRASNKGAIGSAGLFFLMKSLGYKASINVRADKPDVYRITASDPSTKFRYKPSAVKKIIPIQPAAGEYIYDMQTESHHFAAGVGQIVVHNSNYVSFPHLNTAAELWDYAEHVAAEITKLYPSAMTLAFEEVIYWRFFIITKKRYMSIACYRDGVLDKKIHKKGVLLQRRDNCQYIRNTYAARIQQIFDRVERDTILYDVIQSLNDLCGHRFPSSDFIITKSIGDIGALQITASTNDKGAPCHKVGDYTVKLLPKDEEKRKYQFKLKDCGTEKEYYLRSLPAQVQLAERMRRRGQIVDPGSRLEYLITTNGGHTAKQYVKVESSDYFKKHAQSLEIDHMYYLKQLTNPMDQVLDIMFDKDTGHKYKYQRNFVLEQYKYRLRVRGKMMVELKALFTPEITFI